MNKTLEEKISSLNDVDQKLKSLQKEYRDIKDSINNELTEELINLGLYKAEYDLVRNVGAYSFKAGELYMRDCTIKRNIVRFLDDIKVDYISISTNASLQIGRIYQGNITLAIKFDMLSNNEKMKEFIKEKKITIYDVQIQSEIARLQEFQKQYMV